LRRAILAAAQERGKLGESATHSSLPMEIELKLLIDPAAAAALRRHPLLRAHAAGKPVARQLTSIYFDTPDCHLRQQGIALRVRRIGRGWVQTLKGGGGVSAGLHSRDEWEAPVARAAPDLPALIALAGAEAPAARTLAREGLAEILAPVFATRFRRTAWLLRFDGGDQVELALDQGAVEQGERGEPISEVELELKHGDPARLFELALQLQGDLGLRIGNESKAQRGYALCAPQPPQVVKAAPLELAPEQSVEQGLLAILVSCLAQVQGNEAGVAQGRDPESVHQMRVGLRRLRAALKLFERAAPCPPALDAELRWLSGQLGEARDWEVLAGTTLAVLQPCVPQHPELLRLLQAAHARAGKARSRAAAALASARYARLLLEFGDWMQCRRWRAGADAAALEALDAPLAQFAEAALAQARRKLKKRGKPVRARHAQTTAQDRHRMRIAAKRMRYAAEFFAALFRGNGMRKTIGALSGLQDALGLLNDTAVATQLLDRLAARRPALARAAGFACGYLEAEAARKLRKLPALAARKRL
jgi:triphosphatase